MTEQPEWSIEWYQTAAGQVPLRTFLESLTGDHKDQAAAMLAKLRRDGNQVQRSRPVESGLFELKGYQVRLYYVFRPGRKIIILDGDVKKQDKISQDVLKRLRAYRRDLEEREAKGS